MATKILSIDDDAVFGLVVQKLFRNDDPNHQVVTKTSLHDALTYLSALRDFEFPDIILVDVNMPDGGAFQFLELFKKNRFDSYDADLYFITSSIFPEDRRKVLNSSLVLDIFHKPFSQDEVSQMLL